MVRPVRLQQTELKGVRGFCARIAENPRFVKFITILILINAVTLGLETNHEFHQAHYGFFHVFDLVIISIFCIELLLKLCAYGWSFFLVGWNVFDFIVVGISLIPATGPLSILRALRVLRVLRLLTTVPQMRRVISALLESIPGMASVISVLLVIFYVSAVLATQTFGTSPDPQMQSLFGSFSHSMYTLFKLMTLEGWSEGVAEPTMVLFPWSWVFFVLFIIITSFAVLNLFIGIIVDAMSIVQAADLEEETKEVEQTMHEDTAALRQEIQSLRSDIAELKSLVRDSRSR